MIKQFEIDTTHFVRYQNGSRRRRLTADQILVEKPFGTKRTDPALLRRALDEIGRPRVCERCGVNGVWLGGPLRLEIDHIDGDFHNNTRENLRYLCPNCHQQTDNFAGRSRNKYARVLPDDVARPLSETGVAGVVER
ncbi:HNH endonuclease signature motif containing protein [Nocardioides dilutus]